MNIGDMMPASQKKEMVQFFVRELKTPTWMRALSTRDLDVTFSIRPDHQWTGAYCSWPALALSGLFVAGEVELAHGWMKGLAKTSMQGPYAQAHFIAARGLLSAAHLLNEPILKIVAVSLSVFNVLFL